MATKSLNSRERQPLQLIVTASTPSHVGETQTPESLELHLTALAEHVGLCPQVGPLVGYSSRPGNGGFTGFIAGPRAHVDLHHWDIPVPGVLQLDIFSMTNFDPDSVLSALSDYWECDFLFAGTVDRGMETLPKMCTLCGDASFLLPEMTGMGPGDHSHLLIRVDELGDLTAAHSESDIQHFLTELVESIDMTVLIRPRSIIGRGTSSPFATGIVGITTSHIAFHFLNTSDGFRLYLDVFSCSPFDAHDVIHQVEHTFSCRAAQVMLLTRYPRHVLSSFPASHLGEPP